MRYPCKKKKKSQIFTRGCLQQITEVEGAMGLASGGKKQKKKQLTYMAKYGFRQDLMCTLFFENFFLSLFIISVSIYTQRNLFVYTAFIRSIPEHFL